MMFIFAQKIMTFVATQSCYRRFVYVYVRLVTYVCAIQTTRRPTYFHSQPIILAITKGRMILSNLFYVNKFKFSYFRKRGSFFVMLRSCEPIFMREAWNSLDNHPLHINAYF